MTIWWLAFILGSLVAVFLGFIWVVVKLNDLQDGKKGKKKTGSDLNKAYSDVAEEEVGHLFNKEFREELRNRGRLRFEQIIDNNAMFLKQDLDMTISQLNEYMKGQISAKLEDEFAAYSKAMKEAQEMTLGVLQKTAGELEQQRQELSEAMKKSMTVHEANMLQNFETNMAEVVEHYVMQSLGEQFDMKAQLPYIMRQMEMHKKEMMEDMLL
ncbi:MAG TPA: hypothetical protein VMB52_06700 [Verrucomicrobiae bacterium]|nr:hypothetical protein [Verrucomicrobiae bacterium]